MNRRDWTSTGLIDRKWYRRLVQGYSRPVSANPLRFLRARPGIWLYGRGVGHARLIALSMPYLRMLFGPPGDDAGLGKVTAPPGATDTIDQIVSAEPTKKKAKEKATRSEGDRAVGMRSGFASDANLLEKSVSGWQGALQPLTSRLQERRGLSKIGSGRGMLTGQENLNGSGLMVRAKSAFPLQFGVRRSFQGQETVAIGQVRGETELAPGSGRGTARMATLFRRHLGGPAARVIQCKAGLQHDMILSKKIGKRIIDRPNSKRSEELVRNAKALNYRGDPASGNSIVRTRAPMSFAQTKVDDLTRMPKPDMVWRQSKTESAAASPLLSVGASGGARTSSPLKISSAIGSGLPIARQTMGVTSSAMEAGSLGCSEASTLTAERAPAQMGGMDLQQVAEQVSRLIFRRLAVERERRGIGRWH